VAPKRRRAEMVLIPLLDILQSVPVLGYLSFTVVFLSRCPPAGYSGPSLPLFLQSSRAKPGI
jgi:NitT/TauT family transport system permease protein